MHIILPSYHVNKIENELDNCLYSKFKRLIDFIYLTNSNHLIDSLKSAIIPLV